MKAIERIIELLPVPFLIGVALVVLGAWLTKELRGFSDYGPALRDPILQSAALLIMLGVAGYYGVQWIVSRSTPSEFTSATRGVGVAKFDGDAEGRIQKHTTEALRTAILKDTAFSDVIIAPLRTEVRDEDAHEVAKRLKASLIIYGTFVSPDVIHYRLTLASAAEVARLPLAKFPTTSSLEAAVRRYLETTPPAAAVRSPQSVFLEQQIKQLDSERKEQAHVVAQLRDRLSQLDTTLRSDHIGKVLAALAQRTKRVLSIGINNYRNLPGLKFAQNDATEFVNAVKKTHPGKVESRVVLDATHSDILESFAWLVNTTAEDDIVFIFFAGQAVVGQNGSFLLPQDADSSSLASKAISADQIAHLQQALRARQVILFLDVCYGGAFAPYMTSQQLSPLPPSSNSLSENARVVILSSGKSQLATESYELGHGLFSYFLIRGLYGDADMDGDGFVSARELFMFISEGVVKRSSETGLLQNPVMSATNFDDFIVAVH